MGENVLCNLQATQCIKIISGVFCLRVGQYLLSFRVSQIKKYPQHYAISKYCQVWQFRLRMYVCGPSSPVRAVAV